MSVDRELLSRVLPAYDIGAELGAGGWGVVVAGQHRQLHRPVAIKQLPPELSADPAVRRRFAAEARVLASLDHPHVVPVYDFVERDGVCLLVMELLPGGTLRSRASDGAGLTAPKAVALSLACASGLSAAHRRGILHRDVKPDNLLFAASGVLKVTDFGIAKVIGGADTVMTRAGDVLGTPAYIAPEQVLGGELSPATDVYALATMLYQLLAGVFPFSHDGPAVALLFKHAHEAPTPLRDVAPHVPEAVAAVVMRGLATDPAQRFQTAESFGAALAQAGTKAWHAGWLWAEQVPILDAEPIVNAAGYPSAPRSAVAPPTIAPGLLTREDPPGTLPSGAASSGTEERADTQASPAPVPGRAQAPRPTPGARESTAPAARDSAVSALGDSAAPAPRDSAAGRRRILVVAVVVAVIVIAIIAILVLPGLFKVYRS
jgi:serine/threonine protein kinase